MTPQLRFPEFTDEWQVKKLGDIGSVITGSTPITADRTLYGSEYQFISPGDMNSGRYVISTKQRLSQKGFDISRKIKTGSTLFVCIGSTIGKTAQVREMSVTNQQINAVVTNDDNNDDFIYLALSKISTKIALSAGAQAVPIISKSDFSKNIIHIPSKPEQEKIADFLTAVDERIGVSEKKLELLETYKRGVMQKIFSQQIRFKDENGKPYPDWEEKAVSEFLKERKEYTSKGGDLEHISLTTSGVVPKSERYERDFLVGSTDKQYRITRLDDICYNPANLKFGVIARNKYKDGIFSPIYVTYVVNNADIGFVEYLVTSRDFIQRARKYEQGTVYERMAVSPQDLAKLKVRMPVIEEQQKIATFLTTLDEKITAEKSKLTAARKFKKALLQRMFV